MKNFDIIIVGGGVVGCTLASGLLSRGFSVALVERKPFQPRWPISGFDARVSSINLASVAIFQHLSVWPCLRDMRVQPFSDIKVLDTTGGGFIHFDAAAVSEPCLGYIIEHHVLSQCLYQNLNGQKDFHYFAPAEISGFDVQARHVTVELTDNKRLQAKLLVAADGSRSQLRNMADIPCRHWSQQHQAVVATVKPSRPHRQTAWQFFFPTGPLAFLPLSDDHFSIVWSLPVDKAEAMLAMDEADFMLELQRASDNRFGPLTPAGPRASFPLRPLHAERYVRPRFCLAGDAAHTIHPLAGQGVNLGLLDAASLVDVVQNAAAKRKDIGAYGVLRQYERWRKPYNRIMLEAMEGFAALFGNRNTMVAPLRNTGLSLTDRFTPAKHWFIKRACGLHSDLPTLACRTDLSSLLTTEP